MRWKMVARALSVTGVQGLEMDWLLLAFAVLLHLLLLPLSVRESLSGSLLARKPFSAGVLAFNYDSVHSPFTARSTVSAGSNHISPLQSSVRPQPFPAELSDTDLYSGACSATIRSQKSYVLHFCFFLHVLCVIGEDVVIKIFEIFRWHTSSTIVLSPINFIHRKISITA